MQAVQLGAHLQLGEGTAEVHPREHLVGLGGLVATAEQHRLGVVADELDPLEVGHDRPHHEREHPPAGELARRRPRCRLELVVLELEPERAQVLGEQRPRPGGVVGHETEGVTLLAEPRDSLDGSGNGLAGDMEHSVDIEQDAGHSGHSHRETARPWRGGSGRPRYLLLMSASHAHDHGHGGLHVHGAGSGSLRSLLIALGLNAAYTLFEVIAALLAGSLSLLADAGHNLSDVVALSVAAGAVLLARRPATPNRSFGFRRAEILAALVNAVSLIVIAVIVFIGAARRFADPPEVPAGG